MNVVIFINERYQQKRVSIVGNESLSLGMCFFRHKAGSILFI
jgi:hypothetical protein